MKSKHSAFLILLLVAIDQASKIYIKTNLYLNQTKDVFSWFKIHFTENPGAAWGYQLPFAYGKEILVLFRIFAIIIISRWLYRCIKSKADNLLIFSISLILAGAIGNTIDSLFYGLIFDHSVGKVATLFSPYPYAGFMHGKVVDMLYFPLIDTILPDWFPFWAGERFTFFDPVFNIADTCVSVAVGIMIVFYKKVFRVEVKIF